MKKFWISIGLLVVLAGCGQGQESSSETSSTGSDAESSLTSSSAQTSTDQSKSSTEETTTEQKESAETSQPVSSSEETADASKELAKQFPQTEFPSEIPHENSQALNIASDGNNQKLSVLYYSMDEPLALNHNRLNQEQPIASYRKETFKTKQAAKEAVNAVYDKGGQKVDLGHDITGYKQGAAGSSYLNWQEGNWALVVRASNVEGQSPDETAKDVVEYLEKAFLPAPKDTGQVTIDLNTQDYRAAQVVWQEDNVVYTVTHQDYLSALEMAVSMAD